MASKEKPPSIEYYSHLIKFLIFLMVCFMLLSSTGIENGNEITISDDKISVPIQAVPGTDLLGMYEIVEAINGLLVGGPNDPWVFQQPQLYEINPDNPNLVFSDWLKLYDRILNEEYFQDLLFDVDNPPPKVVVAILDTGIASHPDISPDIISPLGYDFVNDDDDPYDDATNGGHGTGVSGIIIETTDNGISGAGNLPGLPIELLPLKVLDENGNGSFGDVADALLYIKDLIFAGHNIRVVNMSFSADFDGQSEADILMAELTDMGVIFIAAAGNDNEPELSWPAKNPNVIAVMGSNQYGCPAPGSNYIVVTPDGKTTMAIYTVGALTSSGGLELKSGTSLSSPQIGLLTALLLTMNPDLTLDEIATIITNTSTMVEGCDKDTGVGVMNYDEAAAYVVTPPPPTSTFTPFPTVTPSPIPTSTSTPTPTITPTTSPEEYIVYLPVVNNN